MLGIVLAGVSQVFSTIFLFGTGFLFGVKTSTLTLLLLSGIGGYVLGTILVLIIQRMSIKLLDSARRSSETAENSKESK